MSGCEKSSPQRRIDHSRALYPPGFSLWLQLLSEDAEGLMFSQKLLIWFCLNNSSNKYKGKGMFSLGLGIKGAHAEGVMVLKILACWQECKWTTASTGLICNIWSTELFRVAHNKLLINYQIRNKVAQSHCFVSFNMSPLFHRQWWTVNIFHWDTKHSNHILWLEVLVYTPILKKIFF